MIYQNVELYNVNEMIYDEKQQGYLLSRVPLTLKEHLNKKAQEAIFYGTGTEIRFNIKSDVVKITIKRGEASDMHRPGICEIYYGDYQATWDYYPQAITLDETVIVINKKDVESLKKYRYRFDPELIRVILPYDWINVLIKIEGETSIPNSSQIPDKKILFYGSSITHGSTASTPSLTYASLTSHNLGCDLISLGFAGSCFLEKEMAQYIRSLKYNITVLELGINVYGISPIDLYNRAITFIKTLDLTKPTFVIDIFTCVHDLNNEKLVKEYRNIIKNVVKEINNPNVYYICGKKMITRVDGLSIDKLHPSEYGMMEIAEKLTKFIKNKIK